MGAAPLIEMRGNYISYTVVKGKTKTGKLSSYVSAVTASDTRANAAKITPSKASVR